MHQHGQAVRLTLRWRAACVALAYGSFDTGRDLSAFYTRHDYTLTLPFQLSAGDDEQMFYRWRPRG